ncbi:hypothetical protein CL619_02755 [archaeon]|nr:hypothetical protein [archaeon]|tara:strand:- start:297 stop:944 length:648 start_codon:yes stop_codon:yes gene_type:complete
MRRDRKKSGKRGLIAILGLSAFIGISALLGKDIQIPGPSKGSTAKRIVDETLEEYERFGKGKIKESKMCDLIEDTYFPAGNGDGFSCTGDAWSAAFVSYVMDEADVDFPGHYRHLTYFTTIRDNPRSYDCQTETMSKISDIEPGDVLCGGRSGSQIDYNISHGEKRNSHCDVVIKNREDSLLVIGGNVGHSVESTVIPKSDLGNSKYFGFISCDD